MPIPDGREPILPFPDPVPGIDTHSFVVEDSVMVPKQIPAGEYVLGRRWDCEGSSQVWNTCSDILSNINIDVYALKAIRPK